MKTTNENDTCLTCGQTYGWHLEHRPRHPFNSGQDGATDFLKRPDKGDQKSSQQPSQGAQIAGMTTDPVLRIALINAGVITPTQLVAAEESLRVALSQVQGESSSERARRT